ncbi:phosphatases II [Collybia nuda]|uniref:phosphatidylinositol-3,4,5-trisphosphate 3-phosphatase n=1 Tax=Collybia nuda TaxID=64659 RepID=A0A9P5XVH8_9AGAR|nr:phosphatases II [Collybia nuda]
MANYIRRLVSGDKARFKDGKLNMELDLIYLTDQVIIMGYPATGIEGLYRNRREDTKRFLEHRHGKNYWIFNFCPIRENSYDPSFFDGRVSRYPYPDHHAPPLAVMPLLAREMRAWLSGSPDRVAVLHCKAGKGRSGTMACTYLLTLNDTPSPPRLERSYSIKQWAKIRADDAMDIVPDDVDEHSTTEVPLTTISDFPEESHNILDNPDLTGTPEVLSPAPTIPVPGKSLTSSLKDVLDLHTSRRMKAPSSPGKKLKQGVSIPSQRRWLHYWALILAHEAPSYFWEIPRSPGSSNDKAGRPKVRLTEIKLQMRESSGVKINLVRAANIMMGQTNLGKNPTPATGNGYGHVWISLARYDDNFVDVLERWEKHTRDETHIGSRKPGTEHLGEEEVGKIFSEGIWDSRKMVRSFARLGPIGDGAVVKTQSDKEGKVVTYTLRPLSNESWDDLRDTLQNEDKKLDPAPEGANIPASESNSISDLTQGTSSRGVILDASREVRVKLYMGQVFMGWIWFIPAFHLPERTFASGQETTRFSFTRKEVDFPLGVGSEIISVEICLEWLGERDNEIIHPPARLSSQDEETQGKTGEPSGITALHAVTAATASDIVQAKQAAEN